MRQKIKRVKTPTVLQMEAVECGAAALSIIMSYYKRFEPLEKLRVECGVSRDGSNALNLLKAARKFGFEAKGYKKDIEKLKQLQPPYIIFWEFNHYLVVEGFKKNKVYLNDPAMGHRTVNISEFSKSYTGVVLYLKPGENFKSGGRKLSIFPALYKRLKNSKADVAFILLVSFFLLLPGIAIPIFSKVFIDDYLIKGMKFFITAILTGIGIAITLKILLTYLREYILLRFETKLNLVSSAGFLWHILQLPVNFYYQRYAGEIVNRVRFNNDIARGLSRRISTAFLDIIMILFYGIVLLFISVPLFTIILVGALINIIVAYYMDTSLVDSNQKLQQQWGKTVGTTMGGLSNIETVKAMASENDLFTKWSGRHANFILSQQELGLKAQIFSLSPLLINSLAETSVLFFGALLIMKGKLTLGMFVAFQGMSGNFISPLKKMINLASLFQNLKSKLIRLDDVFNHNKDVNIIFNNLEKENLKKLSGNIELRNICFGYSILDEPLIRGFSLKIPPGARIALVGATGSGKSTVGKIITGLYKQWSGDILFDNKNREEILREVLNASISFVDQNIILFSGTLRENITLWDRTILEEDIIKACKDACIYEDISLRKGGLDSIVEEKGGNFSGGQRQRIEIARALVKNPRILILDEATSALDPVVEKQIDRNIRKRGCTSIIIAHRLSTIRDSDEIIVLEKGKVIQRGTHEQLIKQGNSYYSKLVLDE